MADADDTFTRYYMGGPRHAPQPQFSDSTPLRQNPVGSMSTPPLDPSEIGTGAITNRASRRPSRRRGSVYNSDLGVPAGPLSSHGEAFDEVAAAAKLGPYAPDSKASSSKAESMSDADPERPTVTPLTDENAPLLTRIRSKLGGIGTDYFAGD
jgi:hypothetical protein